MVAPHGPGLARHRGLGEDIGQDDCAIIGLGRFPSRAQVFTVSPMAAMICGPGLTHAAAKGLAGPEGPMLIPQRP